MDWTALQTRTNAACLAAFGESVLLNGVTVQADYCEPSDEVYLQGVSAVANATQVVVASEWVPAHPVGKTVVARGRIFTVADARPDGRGLTTLMLEGVL